MKRLLLAWLLLALTGLARAEGSFMAPERLAVLQGLNEVYIADLNAMLRSPRYIPPAQQHPRRSPFHQRLSEEDRLQLLDLLTQSSALSGPPAPENCRYQPGYRLDFVAADGQVASTLLVCFNCNVWAVASQPGFDPRPAAASFGTAQAQRPQLLELMRHYSKRAPKQ